MIYFKAFKELRHAEHHTNHFKQIGSNRYTKIISNDKLIMYQYLVKIILQEYEE
jgi:hypothetical protein